MYVVGEPQNRRERERCELASRKYCKIRWCNSANARQSRVGVKIECRRDAKKVSTYCGVTEIDCNMAILMASSSD